MPRLVLLLFCLAYLLPGFIGRDAWKGADIEALGWMAELADGTSHWLHPTLVGAAPENPGLLPYWLGAWALEWCPHWMAPDFAVRIPFALLLAVVLSATWQATYYLARSRRAQPVAFAFGGEPAPREYASALVTEGYMDVVALAQLGFAAMLFYALAALPWRPINATLLGILAQFGLSLSGAPAMAMLFALGGIAVHWLDPEHQSTDHHTPTATATTVRRCIGLLLLGAVGAVATAAALSLWRWKINPPQVAWAEWNGFVELLTWFTWPAWPLALWTVWRWRRQLFTQRPSRHLLLPLWFVLVTLPATLFSGASDRALLLTLPALATLAAFALPTLQRQMASLIDWFTLLFFSGCGVIIWVVWIAMQTGFPSQPSANVARLAPGFTASFSFGACAIAICASLFWAWLVKWRVGRHRAAIWKSLVLPAGGAALCWLLLMTLWMPLLNYAQSYNALVQHSRSQLQPAGCIETLDLGPGKLAAFQFYGKVQLRPASSTANCPWLIAEPGLDMAAPANLDPKTWLLLAAVMHPTDGNESVLLFKRR